MLSAFSQPSQKARSLAPIRLAQLAKVGWVARVARMTGSSRASVAAKIRAADGLNGNPIRGSESMAWPEMKLKAPYALAGPMVHGGAPTRTLRTRSGARATREPAG